MQWTRLYVDKRDGTFADALTVFGLAELVHQILARQGDGGDVHLRDEGSYYLLTPTVALSPAVVRQCDFFLPAQFIMTEKNKDKLPEPLPEGWVISYETERDRRAAYFEMRSRLSQEALQAERAGGEHPLLDALKAVEPHKHWDILRAINPEALIGYNNLLQRWWELGQSQAFGRFLSLLLEIFSQTPNDIEQAKGQWRSLAREVGVSDGPQQANLQIYNPAKGKGQNRPKPDRLTMGNLKDFWPVELLKAVGFYQAAITKVLRGPGQPDRSNDRKTFVVNPSEISYRDLNAVMDAFRGLMVRSETARRLDVLAALRFTQALLRHMKEPEGSRMFNMLAGQSPRRVVSGFQTAFYKDLGQGKATMNISFINLPGWVIIRNKASVDEYLYALEEHEGIIRQFQEDRGEDITLLGHYRDFTSGDDIWPFFAFTACYAGWLMSQREQTGRGRQLTTTNLGRLLMNVEPKLSEIIQSEGFQAVAYAIRQATVTAQYRRSRLGDRRYDVYYGLGQKLARKAPKAEDFVAELMDFIRAYNAENAQVMENREGPYRRSVRTTDVEEIVRLIDQYGSRLVGNMLVAYGYAREPWERAEEESASGGGEQAPEEQSPSDSSGE